MLFLPDPRPDRIGQRWLWQDGLRVHSRVRVRMLSALEVVMQQGLHCGYRFTKGKTFLDYRP
jgi:hypothetical protein